jgi:hypothetical protein
MSESLHFEVEIDMSKFYTDINKMESRIKSLESSIGGSTAPLNQPLKETGDHLDNVSKKAKTTSSAFSEIKNFIGFAAIAAGAKQLVGEIINVTAEYQKYQAVLTNSLGSETLAKQSLSELTEFAAKTPFALTELTGAYVKLNNYGLKPSMEEMRKYGDLASSVGKGFDQLAEAAADAVTGEFERLKEFGIKSKKEGDKITFTFKEQETVVNNNAEAIKNYITGLGDMQGVAGSMAAESATLGGQISNLGDNWSSLMKAMGGESDGVFASIIKGLNEVIETATWAVKSTKTIRDEVLQKSISDSGAGIKEEVQTMAIKLREGGGYATDEDAQKRAVELYQKQLEESIVQAQAKYDEVVEKSKSTGKKFIFGKQYKEEVKAIQEAHDKLKLLQGEKDIIPSLFTEKKADKKTPVATVEFKSAPGSIARIEEELKKLKAKTGTFTNPEQENKNISAISEKTKELEAAWKKVREEQNKASGISLTGDNGKNDKLKLQVGQLATKASNTQLATMKKLTKEEEDQLKLEQQKVLAGIQFSENTEELATSLNDASALFGEMSSLVGVFDEGLGEALGTMSEIAGQGASFVTSISSHDWVGAITSGLSLITTVVSQIKESNEANSQTQEEINAKATELNNILMERIQILVDSGMITEMEGVTAEILKQNEAIDLQREKISLLVGDYTNKGVINFQIAYKKGDNKSTTATLEEIMKAVYGDDWTSKELEYALANQTELYKAYFASLGADFEQLFYFQSILDESNPELAQSINDLGDLEGALKKLEEEFVGFTGDDLASSIADGIMNGFKLGADGALGDFTDSFKDLLKKAALNALTTSFEAKYFNDMQTKMTEAMGAESLGGKTVTEDEIAAMQTIYSEGISAMQASAEAWNLIIGDTAATTEDANGLSGSIKASLTEETGSLLAGKINSMQTHVISISNSVSEMRGIAVSQLESLRTIAGNTSYNWHLQSVAEDMKAFRKSQTAISESLTQIVANTGGANYDL